LETAGSPQVPAGSDAVIEGRLWAYRERQPDSVSSLGQVQKLDVGVPLGRLSECVAELSELVTPHDVYVFGHLAEGNLHVEIVGPSYDDFAVEVRVLEYIASLGGTVSAEHGVGRAKASHLHLSRDATSLTAMRAIKDALDPQGLLNPGAVLV
jgi:FAD/FMN-containing dehydrogenase